MRSSSWGALRTTYHCCALLLMHSLQFMHACMWQAQAILRKSIRDTTAEDDLEDPDKEFKDDSDSDAPQRNRGRGKGRGRGRGRARGRARGKHEEKAATTAGEALETLEARSQTECPEMPTHVLPKNLSSALDKAAQYVTNDMKEATVATHDHDNEEGQAKKEKQPTAAKSKASRAKKRSIPSQTLTMNRKQLWKQNMRHRALVPEASQQRHRPTASPHQKKTRVANRKTLLPKRPPRQLHEKLARRSTRTHPAYMINFFCAHEDVMCVLCGVMGFDCLLNHVIFVIVNSVCENIMLFLLDHFRKLPSGDKHFHPAWFGREPASSAFARRLCQPKAPSSDSHGRGFRRDQVVNPDDSNRNSSQN